MFKMTEKELQRAFEAIEYHGYSALFPRPKEWDTVKTAWKSFRKELATIDLDEYQPSTPIRVYAPKSRINVRAMTLLHPQDLILYTGMALLVKNDLEAARMRKSQHRVFSYRSKKS